MSRILKTYLKRLTNLSTRNKSLLLTNLAAEQFFDLHDADFLLGKSSVEIIRQLVQRKVRIPICDVIDPRYAKVNDASKRLRKISRTEVFIREERGSQDLYVGYPFVKGKLSDGTPIHAPLLFFPVTLQMDREQWCIFIREETEVVLNQSFALAYGHFNEAHIPDEILETSLEDFSKDFLEFRTQLYEWIKTTPFKINFNQDLFEDKLTAFSLETRSELSEKLLNGELKLFPEAVLGIFPQAGSYLVPDYQTLLDRYENQSPPIPLLNPEMNGNPAETLVERRLREEELLTPFSMDESQEQVILAVKSGESLVVQGPPGSGKSQLICNLMTDFAARGKRVLVVCQKRAALDVVYQRIQTIGLQDFVGLIHDFKNDRSGLYAQLAQQIESVEAYRHENYSLDTVFLERNFTQESRVIDKTVADLNAFRHALFDENECGMSVKELYLTSDPSAPQVDLRDTYRHFSVADWDAFKRRLKSLAGYRQLIPIGHPWHVRRDFSTFSINHLREMESLLRDWPTFFSKQKTEWERIANTDFALTFIQNKNEVLERLRDIESNVQEDLTFFLLKKYAESAQQVNERLAFVRQATDALEGFLSEDGVEFSLATGEVNSYLQRVKKAAGSKGSAVSGFWWDLFSKEKKDIENLAHKNGLTTSSEDLEKLTRRLINRRELETWLSSPLLGFDLQMLDMCSGSQVEKKYLDYFRHAETAADALARANYEQWSAVMQGIINSSSHLSDFEDVMKQLIRWLEVWLKVEDKVLVYLMEGQFVKLLADPARESELLLTTLKKDFDSLVDMDLLWKEMSEAEEKVAKKLIDTSEQSGLSGSDTLPALFDNSIRLAWIEHIETKYPDLRSVTSLKMEHAENQIQKSIDTKQKLSSDIAAIKLREGTFREIEKNRLGNRITYRELGHQVTKKRRIWPIRKLVENYSDEIFSLIPCWMASPDAVSAIFPMEKDLFDLVIFDEASQCYAESGVPAAYRGRQIVVAGDSKQLSPSDLYRVRYEVKEEEEYSAATDIESLLDLAGQSMKQYQLNGHYRSLSLDLIDFSNKNFYKNSLKLLPDFDRVNHAAAGIQYIKTEGIWSNNINQTEAEKVTEIVRQLSETGKSVGVVTFNFFQQQAIQDLLETEKVFAKDLFVKNIENVQGDERDIIIFSMGYAPDQKGKISMHFGSLNMQGGENRLNVAITRAREKIYFVTSLWPGQLQTEQTANAGPKMLRAYLDYALQVSEGNYRPAPAPTTQFRSDWLLKEKLVTDRPDFEKELPFADITVKEEGAYKSLILTDDDLYFYSKSSKEPHAYLPLLLRLKNWPYRRVYSRQYWSGALQENIL